MSTSHGRGGAGNITSQPSPSLKPTDLTTPHIKTPLYTTGRGGSGNIVPNDDASSARIAQDVEAPPPKELSGTYHWGRGGEGNMTVVGKSEAEQRKGASAARPRMGSKERRWSKSSGVDGGEGGSGGAGRRGSFQGLMNRGKEMLGLKEKNGGSVPKEGSAIKNETAIE